MSTMRTIDAATRVESVSDNSCVTGRINGAHGVDGAAGGPGKKAGRPRIITSPEEMDRLAEEYLTKCREDGEPVTLTGMILHLGLSSRQSLDRYADRPEFGDSVKRAKLGIEHEYERRLDRDRPAGAIFALKQFGWSDRTDLNVRALVGTLDVTRLSDEQLTRIASGEDVLAVLATTQPLPALSPGGEGR